MQFLFYYLTFKVREKKNNKRNKEINIISFNVFQHNCVRMMVNVYTYEYTYACIMELERWIRGHQHVYTNYFI